MNTLKQKVRPFFIVKIFSAPALGSLSMFIGKQYSRHHCNAGYLNLEAFVIPIIVFLLVSIVPKIRYSIPIALFTIFIQFFYCEPYMTLIHIVAHVNVLIVSALLLLMIIAVSFNIYIIIKHYRCKNYLKNIIIRSVLLLGVGIYMSYFLNYKTDDKTTVTGWPVPFSVYTYWEDDGEKRVDGGVWKTSIIINMILYLSYGLFPFNFARYLTDRKNRITSIRPKSQT